MSACTFFGHRDCYDLKESELRGMIKSLMIQGVDTFYVGDQGHFDGMVYRCLKNLREEYPQIHICVVLAKLPGKKREQEDLSDTMYPEIEGHPRFSIERRNRWMINAADFCLCYVDRTWGGAYKFARLAKRRGLQVINLGKIPMK